MPLPLPNLDTRRWDDLIEEGRALIPRYAPEWTDHNVHDPGIMLMELFAYLVEQDIFRLNQVPNRHKRKFLNLIGFNPQPPQAAQTVLCFTPVSSASPQSIPSGVLVASADGQRFQLMRDVTVIDTALTALLVDNGDGRLADRTPVWREGLPLALFGENPMAAGHSAFYLGFDAPLPAGETVSLWFALDGDHRTDRDAILAQQALWKGCLPGRPGWRCGPNDDSAEVSADELPTHYSVRLEWSFYDGTHWRMLDAETGEVEDTTYGMTVSGAVRVTLPQPTVAVNLGSGPEAHYLRCQMMVGPPDAAPILQSVTVNAVAARQAVPAKAVYPIASGVVPPVGAEPMVGAWQYLRFGLNSAGEIAALAVDDTDETLPLVFVSAYTPATAMEAGTITLDLVMVGRGTGAPEQHLTLLNAPVAGGDIALWTLEAGALVQWTQRVDLDASGREGAHFMLNAMTGQMTFGNGLQGRVIPDGVPVFAQFERTRAAAGNGAAADGWLLAGVDDAHNGALLGGDVAAVAANLTAIKGVAASSGGTDAETLTHAAGRAAATLWAHERLVELSEKQARITLDQMPRERVMALTVPDRAVTLLDYERLALAIPGTQIARVRAWSGLDPNYPCLEAVGTVTLIVVPELPLDRPVPTPGLINTVGRFFAQRKVLGTRLVVNGPEYVTVRVQARVRARAGQNLDRVQADIHTALREFLNPLHGGPDGRGWPFGRDVYRTEILQVIDTLPGVDHVLHLELMGADDDEQCGNLCVGPTALVLSGSHQIEVVF